jgi:hypothetical protein
MVVPAYGGIVALITVVSVVKDDVPGLRLTLDSFGTNSGTDSRILVLDGSTDRDSIPNLLQEYSFLDIEYRWSPPIGVYGAMNQALEFVRSEYVYFLNAGDRLASEQVPAKLNSVLARDSPLWAFGRVLFFTERGESLPEPKWSYQEERRRLFARGLFPAHQGVVVRTEALHQQGGFDRGFHIAADYASILKLSCEAAPLELDFPLAIFQQGGLSTTEWRLSLREFHRARVNIFQPSGMAALCEYFDTFKIQMKTHAYRSVQRLRHAHSTDSSSAASEIKQ